MMGFFSRRKSGSNGIEKTTSYKNGVSITSYSKAPKGQSKKWTRGQSYSTAIRKDKSFPSPKQRLKSELSRYHNPLAFKQKSGYTQTTTKDKYGNIKIVKKSLYRKPRRISGRGTTKVRPKTHLALGLPTQRQQPTGFSVFQNVNPLGEPDYRPTAAIQPSPFRPVTVQSVPATETESMTQEDYKKYVKSLRNRADYLRRRYGVVKGATPKYQDPQYGQPQTQPTILPQQQKKKSILDFPSVLD